VVRLFIRYVCAHSRIQPQYIHLYVQIKFRPGDAVGRQFLTAPARFMAGSVLLASTYPRSVPSIIYIYLLLNKSGFYVTGRAALRAGERIPAL
jgi:hypothetical protein